ncbi:hypothetical protein [Sphingobacterium bovistauri]|uniref:Lipoprotein n=1 Tax=Sphingobacterium bovistauri TaxID=2781959 RepID=A0ABS7Z9J3_9SPHI|nr:hypothetical protein [Sphingobacterium bovistauri]MCA5005619.1 hypothetical protein [Sphingobacterium bovistauri]
MIHHKPGFTILGLMLLLIFTQLSCSSVRTKQPEFILYENKQWIRSEGYVGRIYFVRNYEDDVNTLLAINEFIFQLLERDSSKNVSTYSVSFYRESEKTNLEHLAINPRDFDRHSFDNDLRYIFKWRDGKFALLRRYEDGEVIYPPDDGSIELLDYKEESP